MDACAFPMMVIIFSRDRALQLDGVIRSFFLHCADREDARLHVIYKATNTLHSRQYDELKQEYDGAHGLIRFVQQQHFRRDVLDLLMLAIGDGRVKDICRFMLRLDSWYTPVITNSLFTFEQKSCVLFLVDDNIFTRSFSLREAHEMLIAHKDALGFSLRLGTNTTYCYSLDRHQTLPHFMLLRDGILKFNWTSAQCDFGYPLEVSSSIYRLGELLPFLIALSFDNPNTLEGRMAKRTRFFKGKEPFLLCYEQSVTFCNPINKVQTSAPNRAGSVMEYSSERLAKLFESGYRISVEAYSGHIPNACHQEVNLVLENRKALA